MTLTRLLEIDRNLLEPEAERGLALAETWWVQNGSPREPGPLCQFLETVLQRCKETGVCYPRIVLRRKKELERGTWRPSAASPSAASRQQRETNGSACADCGDSGYVYRPDGASLCACGGWNKSAAKTTVVQRWASGGCLRDLGLHRLRHATAAGLDADVCAQKELFWGEGDSWRVAMGSQKISLIALQDGFRRGSLTNAHEDKEASKENSGNADDG